MISQKCGMAIYTPMPTVHGPMGARLEPITVEWHRSRMNLAMPTNFSSVSINMDGMEVGEARCKAVDVAMGQTPRPTFLFSLDYDVLPAYDALTKLVYRAKTFPDHDIFAGVYCSKGSPPEPLIYVENGNGPHWDWTVGDLLTEGVTGVHMGLTLIRMSLFDRMEYGQDNPLFKTREKEVQKTEGGGIACVGGTEDLYFCDRAISEAGAKILVDTSVLAGHIHHGTGQIFGLLNDSPPIKRCPWMGKGKVKRGLKKCLDVGAGDTKREWDGYRTYTLDIRPDTNRTLGPGEGVGRDVPHPQARRSDGAHRPEH
jgi:hypothetical protein